MINKSDTLLGRRTRGEEIALRGREFVDERGKGPFLGRFIDLILRQKEIIENGEPPGVGPREVPLIGVFGIGWRRGGLGIGPIRGNRDGLHFKIKVEVNVAEVARVVLALGWLPRAPRAAGHSTHRKSSHH
jgi:hypothetical protein